MKASEGKMVHLRSPAFAGYSLNMAVTYQASDRGIHEGHRVIATVDRSWVRCFLLCWPQGLSNGLTEKKEGSQPLASTVVLSHEVWRGT
jgi:hypothetical protein